MYIKLPGCHRNVLYIFNLDDAVTKLFNSSISNKKKKKTILLRNKNRIWERVYGEPFTSHYWDLQNKTNSVSHFSKIRQSFERNQYPIFWKNGTSLDSFCKCIHFLRIKSLQAKSWTDGFRKMLMRKENVNVVSIKVYECQHHNL